MNFPLEEVVLFPKACSGTILTLMPGFQLPVGLGIFNGPTTSYSRVTRVATNLMIFRYRYGAPSSTFSAETIAKMCIEWYSWRWTLEEVFKILKEEGYNIEASELAYGSSVRKMCLLIMEVIIKLFLMRLAYAKPEVELGTDTCFTEEEQEFLEHQVIQLEGKTEKQKESLQNKRSEKICMGYSKTGWMERL